MLVSGLVFTGGRVFIEAGAGQVPDFISGGFGFMDSANALAVDTDAPAGSVYVKGFRMSPNGAVYGTTTPDDADVYHEGIRRSTAGQIVYEAAAASTYSSRNPVTSNGRFGITT